MRDLATLPACTPQLPALPGRHRVGVSPQGQSLGAGICLCALIGHALGVRLLIGELECMPGEALPDHLKADILRASIDTADITRMHVFLVARNGRRPVLNERAQSIAGDSPIRLARLRGVAAREADGDDSLLSPELQRVAIVNIDDGAARFEGLIGGLIGVNGGAPQANEEE